ncbi:MAG: efflux RND transporter permease subunit [Patescibacteria group bacterium]|nr:efflux RND transporter permease subunit [Patescibacteria group bacterium]
MNDLITKKIENEIENINGVKSFDSQSLDSVSSIMVTLENDADSSDVTNKIEDAVKRVSLPSDANDPVVALVDTEAMKQVLFYMNLYAKDDRFDADYLKQKAKLIKEALEGQGYLDTITITDGDQYDIEVLVDQQKLEQFKLPISQISSLIQGFNQNQPLGTHELGDKEYSFRINGEYVSIEELENMFISLGNGQTIPLSSIATIKRTYPENQRYEIGHFENGEDYHGKLAVTILFNKKRSASILEASKQAKEMIEEELKKPEYENLGYFYTSDLGKQISDDYSELAVNMISTLLIVFIIVRCFVGTVESLLATISIPLAFFITFFVLNGMEFSMNMLTNFSLIICLGIAVDSATVIIQGSSENMKKGFKPLHAALLAVKTYKNSLISGTATTVVVFLPLMSLPGMMGKAISYIPITIFITLLASLFISLTVTPAIFFKMNKDKNTYQKDEESESLMDETAKVILDADRQEKTEVTKKEEKSESSSYRDKILDKLVDRYDKKIRKVVENKKSRALRVILPIVILVFTLLFVSTNLGFLMMPADDNEQMGITLKAEAGITEDKIREKAEGYHEVLASIPELENYQASIKGNKISIDLKLVEKSQRDRTSFEVEDELTEKLQFLKERGFEVSISIEGFASQL